MEYFRYYYQNRSANPHNKEKVWHFFLEKWLKIIENYIAFWLQFKVMTFPLRLMLAFPFSQHLVQIMVSACIICYFDETHVLKRHLPTKCHHANIAHRKYMIINVWLSETFPWSGTRVKKSCRVICTFIP